jgi:hypothetical protein
MLERLSGETSDKICKSEIDVHRLAPGKPTKQTMPQAISHQCIRHLGLHSVVEAVLKDLEKDRLWQKASDAQIDEPLYFPSVLLCQLLVGPPIISGNALVRPAKGLLNSKDAQMRTL